MSLTEYNSGTMLRQLFEKLFTTVDSVADRHYGRECYQTGNTFVFDPVSDGPSFWRSQSLPLIKTTLSMHSNFLREECTKHQSIVFLFPLVEEAFGRKHIVTLHYSSSTQTATIVDSRPMFASWYYPVSVIQPYLNNAFKELQLNFEVKKLEVKYLNVQQDYVNCGAWTTIIVQALASGMSLDHLSLFQSKDISEIITYLDRVANTKVPCSFEVYQPLQSRPPQPSEVAVQPKENTLWWWSSMWSSFYKPQATSNTTAAKAPTLDKREKGEGSSRLIN